MNTTAARLDLRLNIGDKHRIARAAALREADSAIAADAVVTLSETETRRFLAALDAPFAPNVRLQQAMDAAAQLVQVP